MSKLHNSKSLRFYFFDLDSRVFLIAQCRVSLRSSSVTISGDFRVSRETYDRTSQCETILCVRQFFPGVIFPTTNNNISSFEPVYSL